MTSPRITYNPGILGDEELVRSFVVRKESLELILEALRENAASPGANRHMLIIGPRGSGKTMLVRRVAAEVRANPVYGEHWFPLVFGEESYPVSTPGEFWLEALFHLAGDKVEARWEKMLRELQGESDEVRLRERALAQLLDFADSKRKRLLLVVENLNMLAAEQMDQQATWDLRHTLTNEARLMLLGSATSRFDEITNSDRAWFEMFSVHDLRPLEAQDCSLLWQSVTEASLEPGPLRAVRILTGGNPRLLTILAGFAAKRSFRELMQQLVHLIDDHTEYFKSHLDGLAAKERKAFVALLEHWDPVGAAELAKTSRLGVNETSTMLGRLVGRGAVEVVEQIGRRKLYQVTERLYNIYYLMRRRGHPAGRVRAAVSFMVMFYEREELAARIGELAREACGLPAGAREDHYLAYAEVVRRNRRLARRIIESTPSEFFKGGDAPPFIRRLAVGALKTMLEEAYASYQAGRLEEAEGKYRQVLERNSDDARAWTDLGWVLKDLGRLEEAEHAFRKAIEREPKEAWHWNGLSHVMADLVRYGEAEQALLKAIELEPREALHWDMLGYVLEQLRRYEEAERTARKTIELEPENPEFWRSLGGVLADLDRLQEAKQAYYKAVDLRPEDEYGWSALGHFLLESGPPEEAEQVWARALALHSDLAQCAVHLLDLRHQRGIAPDTIVREAREWVERSERKAQVLEVMARFILRSELKEGLRQAEEWAREAYSKDPQWACADALMSVLAAQEKWKEALESIPAVLDAAATQEEAQRSATDFLINAAASGHARAALERLTASAGAATLEPLVVGLRVYLGETPRVAKEILEVGADVAERIRQRQQKAQP